VSVPKATSLKDATRGKPDDAIVKRIRNLESQISQAKLQREKAEREAKGLQLIVDHQAEILDRRASQLFKSPRSRPSVKGGHFHRVLIPDTHGAHIDPTAAAAFLADLDYLRPREVVWLGDHLDCGGFLAAHHVIGFVPETAVEFPDDIQAGNDFIDQVQARTKQAVHHFLTGNHEHRIERWCCQQALSKTRTAQFFLDRFGVQAVLNLEKRGFHYYPRGYLHAEKRVRGAIKLGNCWFVHDVSTSSRPARDALGKWGTNVCFGDTHRIDMAVSRKAERDIIGATNACLSRLTPYWQETNVTDWSHGYGVQVVTNDGNFLHIIVPIVNGRSLLGAMLGMVK
jgi:hypothetical protein